LQLIRSNQGLRHNEPRFRWPLKPETKASGEEGEQRGLIEHGNAERARLVELRTGIFTSDYIAGFFADRAGDAAAGRLDPFRCLLAGQRRQGAGEDEGEALELR